jgi:hypothetical protein
VIAQGSEIAADERFLLGAAPSLDPAFRRDGVANPIEF